MNTEVIMRIPRHLLLGAKICVHNRRFPTAVISAYRRAFRRSFRQDERCIELEITTICNLGCGQCDRSCSAEQASAKEWMSVDQVEKFISQSVRERRRWRQIKILGGEPTLHAELDRILSLLRRYRDEYSKRTQITVISNGFGKDVDRILASIPRDITVSNTSKTSRKQGGFDTYNVAPYDLEEFDNKDFRTGCAVPEVCGMALTRYGFYTCGAGASVDRVFGFGLGIHDLADATSARLKEQRKVLCSYCGHFKSYGIYSNVSYSEKPEWRSVSPSWVKAYQAFKKQRPLLKLF